MVFILITPFTVYNRCEKNAIHFEKMQIHFHSSTDEMDSIRFPTQAESSVSDSCPLTIPISLHRLSEFTFLPLQAFSHLIVHRIQRHCNQRAD